MWCVCVHNQLKSLLLLKETESSMVHTVMVKSSFLIMLQVANNNHFLQDKMTLFWEQILLSEQS